MKNIMERLGVGDTESIENSLISKSIEQAQSKVEGNNFDMRKYVLEYDDVMNRHRTAIYSLRKNILESSNVKEKIIDYINSEIEKNVSFHISPESSDLNTEEIIENIISMIPMDSASQQNREQPPQRCPAQEKRRKNHRKQKPRVRKR